MPDIGSVCVYLESERSLDANDLQAASVPSAGDATLRASCQSAYSHEVAQGTAADARLRVSPFERKITTLIPFDASAMVRM